MTKEDAIKVLSESIHDGSKVPWDKIVEAVHLSIESLSGPSLPSNLDEAAEKYENSHSLHWYEQQSPFELVRNTFISGAKWMARQGDASEVEVKDDATTSPDFDTEVYNWLKQHGSNETRQLIEMTARHFWEVAQNGGAMLHVADKSYEMGRRDERMEMMKDAIECEVYDLSSNEPHPHIYVNTPGLITGDKVKVIILKAEDEQ